MTQPGREQLVRQLHAAPVQLCLAVAGGGVSAVSDLLAVAGASRTVLEAVVPYSAAAMTEYLGAEPDQSCSEQTSRAMAMTAFERGRRLAPRDPYQLMGVGCTASLASDRPKRGPHRAHVAVQTARSTSVAHLQFDPHRRTRSEEESLTSALVFNSIVQSMAYLGQDQAGKPPEINQLELATLDSETLVTRDYFEPPEAKPWSDLLMGASDLVASCDSSEHPQKTAIFPGAFNPLHDAHRQMVELAEQHLDGPVSLELSITNVDKPPLDFLEIGRRLEQCHDLPVWLTRAATFVEKADLFPQATFIVGADTIARVADVNYYGNEQQRDAAIGSLAASDCRFLVFGRLVQGGFCSLGDLELLPALRQICDGIPEKTFRVDTSSTDLRRP